MGFISQTFNWYWRYGIAKFGLEIFLKFVTLNFRKASFRCDDFFWPKLILQLSSLVNVWHCDRIDSTSL